jgi:hypothetical protein
LKKVVHWVALKAAKTAARWAVSTVCWKAEWSAPKMVDCLAVWTDERWAGQRVEQLVAKTAEWKDRTWVVGKVAE